MANYKKRQCKTCNIMFNPQNGKTLFCSEKCVFDSLYKIDNKTQCWIWQGVLLKKNYGRFYFNGKHYSAHRFSCEQAHGKKNELFACHTCDNPSCVNPNHLYWGTYQDNVDDRVKRNRSNTSKGENHYKSKFKNEDIINIKKLCRDNYYLGLFKELAILYNVAPETIRGIHIGKTYKHINI